MTLLGQVSAADTVLSLALLAVGTAPCVRAHSHRRWEVPGVALATAVVVGWVLAESVRPVLLVVVRGTGVHVGDLLSVPAAPLVLSLSFRGAAALVDAVLWDMDGLLVDTEPLWTVAQVELADRLGGTWDDAVKAAVIGTRLDVAVPTILRWFEPPAGPAEVAEASAWLLDRMVRLTPIPAHSCRGRPSSSPGWPKRTSRRRWSRPPTASSSTPSSRKVSDHSR